MDYEDSFKDLSKKQRGYKAIFDNVTVPYLMSSLQSVIDFIEDPTNFNLILRNQSSEEVQFLSTIPNFITKESLYTLLPQEAQGLVKQLGRMFDSHSVTLRVVVRRRSSRNRLKDVEIFKKMKTNKRGHRRKKKVDEEDLYGIVTKEVEDYDPKEMFLKALSRNNTADAQAQPVGDTAAAIPAWRKHMGITEPSTSNETTTNRQSNGHINASDYKTTKNSIKWKKEGTEEDDSSTKRSSVRSTARTVRRRGTVAARNTKLLEALAVPLDCDKATRMMQKMGWKGGALGARGEGITEPIMPALDIVHGAGLGHSPPRSKRDREPRDSKRPSTSSRESPVKFRILVLENLLQLLRGDDDEREFQLQTPVHTRQMRFIQMALKCFNARKQIGLNSQEEKQLISKIVSIYELSDTLYVEVEYGNNYRAITLIKSENDNIITATKWSRNSSRRGADVDVESTDDSESDYDTHSDAFVYYSKNDIRNLKQTLMDSEALVPSKSLNSLSSRMAAFMAILKFVQSDLDEALIVFQDTKVSKRLKNFLRTCISNINLFAKAKYSTQTENDVYRDILRHVSSKMSVDVISCKKFILQKKGYRRRTDNKETGLNKADTSKKDEPIVDKDLSDTNEIKTKDDIKEYVESDSDNSAITLKDYEVYDINLEDSFSDDSDSDKSRISVDLDGPFEEISFKNQDTSICNAKVVENQNESDKSVVKKGEDSSDESNDENYNKSDINKVPVLNNSENSDLNKQSVSSDGLEVITKNNIAAGNEKKSVENSSEFDSNKESDNVDLSDKTNETVVEDTQLDSKKESNSDMVDLIDNVNISVEKDTEKLFSLCKVNNLDRLLTDSDAKVSVSIDIKMELNTDSFKAFTKQELIEKIENSPNISIDLGITNDLLNTSKRSGENFDCSRECMNKKSKLNHTVAKITFFDNKTITKDIVKTIQRVIHSNIDQNNLPLLKFLGCDNNSVIYRCDSDYSKDWLYSLFENYVLDDSKVKITLCNEVNKTKYKMKAILHCFFELKTEDLFKKIELYNTGINVENWSVIDVKYESNLVVYILEIDSDSYVAIKDLNFTLYCGIDTVEFSIYYE